MISPIDVPWQAINITNRLDRVNNLEEHTKTASRKGNSKDTKDVCEEFESFFIYFILKTMRDAIPKSGLLNGGRSEEIYTSMLDEKLACKMAKHGGIGLSSLLLGQLERDADIPKTLTSDADRLSSPLARVVSQLPSSHSIRGNGINRSNQTSVYPEKR